MVLTDKGIEERGTHEELLALDGIYSELNRNIEKQKVNYKFFIIKILKNF